MVRGTEPKSAVVQPSCLAVGNVIKFSDTLLPTPWRGFFKVARFDGTYRSENGKVIKNPDMGCDRMYTLLPVEEDSKSNESLRVDESPENRVIYKTSVKTSDRAPDTLRRMYSGRHFAFSRNYSVSVVK